MIKWNVFLKIFPYPQQRMLNDLLKIKCQKLSNNRLLPASYRIEEGTAVGTISNHMNLTHGNWYRCSQIYQQIIRSANKSQHKAWQTLSRTKSYVVRDIKL